MVTLYGLKACVSCRKAQRALGAAGVNYRFQDLRDQSLAARQVVAWATAAGWERLLNRKSRTWRELPAASRENLDEAKAVALMAAHPTLIKRPVIERGEAVLVGFDGSTLERLRS